VWHIDKPTPEDIDAILILEEKNFARPWNRTAIINECGSSPGYGFVMKSSLTGSAEGKVVGYIFFRLIVPEMEILRIAVAGNFRGKGIGSILLAHATRFSADKGARTAYLEVRTKNAGALRLYTKSGFAVVQKRPGYYAAENDDALIMSKDIKEDS